MSKTERLSYELYEHSRTNGENFRGGIFTTHFTRYTAKAEIAAYHRYKDATGKQKETYKGHIVGIFLEKKFFLQSISGTSKTQEKLLRKLKSVIGNTPISKMLFFSGVADKRAALPENRQKLDNQAFTL